MSRASRRAKDESELAHLEARFRERLIVALRACAAGEWGLFGQNDVASGRALGRNARRFLPVGVLTLLELGDEIDALRSSLGFAGSNALYARLTWYRRQPVDNTPGEPQLARRFLAEIDAPSGTGESMNGHTLGAGAAGTIALGDLTVNRLGFGAMRLTGSGVWGPPKDRKAAHAVLRRAVELNVNLIDTADSYGPHVNEELIAEALHPYPAGLVIATKAGWQRPGPGQWVPDGRPEHLSEAVHGSLKRLKLERIDLLQFHTPDPKTPFEESVGALAELQRAGKIRHLGLSNVDVGQIERARRITAIVSVQNRLAADGTDDAEERDVLTYCERNRIAYLPWAPLGGGSLRAGAFEAVARAHGATVNQIALAYLLHRSRVIAPIPGTSSIAHLEENVAAASLVLSDDELASLGGE